MTLYPAGPQWARSFETNIAASTLASRLAQHHEFTAATLFQPFGAGRGAVIAARRHMLVMALHQEDGTTWYSVAPSVEMQNLLWSFSNGYTSQWSPAELKVLIGCDNWPELLQLAQREFAAAVRSFERAVEGKPEVDPPAPTPELDADDPSVMEVPADYLYSMSGSEMPECAH